MRIGGLASGMDIDSIVEKLMTAEKAPLNKLYQQKQKYEWQRDAFREINTKLRTLDTYMFDTFKLSSGGFNSKTVTSSNSNFVTATANASAAGNLSFDGVAQLAKNASNIGNQISATGSTRIGNLISVPGEGMTIKLNAIQADGKMLKEDAAITIKADDTIDSVMAKINTSTAGVTALFENGRLAITAKNSGNVQGSAEVVVNNQEGKDLFNALGLTNSGDLASNGTNAIFTVNGIATERSTNTFLLSGYTVTLKSTFNSQATLEAQKQSLLQKVPFALDLIKGATVPAPTSWAQESNGVADYTKSVFDSLSAKNKELFKNSTFGNVSIEAKTYLASLDSTKLGVLKGLNFNDNAAIDALSSSSFSTGEKEFLKSLSGTDKTELTTFDAQFDTVNTGLLSRNAKNLLSTFSDDQLKELAKRLKNADTSVKAKTELDASGKFSEDQVSMIVDLYSTNDANLLRGVITEAGSDDVAGAELIKTKNFIVTENNLASNISNYIKKYTGTAESAEMAFNSLSDKGKDLFKNIAFNSISMEAKMYLAGLDDAKLNALKDLDLTQDGTIDTLPSSSFTAGEKEFLKSLSVTDRTNLKNLATSANIDTLKTINDSGVTLSQNAKNLLSSFSGEQLNALAKNFTNRTALEGSKKFTTAQLDAIAALDPADVSLLNNVENGLELNKAKNFIAYESNLKSSIQDYIKVKNDLVEVETKLGGTLPVDSSSTVQLTATTDSNAMVEKITEFVTKYNELIAEINTKVKEPVFRSYAPLTDEQKAELEEEEIKKWEEKSKSGLLRSDSVLTKGLSSLRSNFMASVSGLGDSTIDALAEIGITTTKNYNDGGQLVIDGEKLRAAITKNADQVASIFTKAGEKKEVIEDGKSVTKMDHATSGIIDRIRDSIASIRKNIEVKAGRETSTMDSYTIGKNMKYVDNRIETWKDKLKNIEDRYWKQYSAMETAINKANQQSALFMQQLS